MKLLETLGENPNISIFNFKGNLTEELNKALNPRLNIYKEIVSEEGPGIDDDCPVCFEGMGGEGIDSVSQCHTCKKFFHKDCIKIWLRKSTRCNCPLCRSTWGCVETYSDDSMAKFNSN
jgi:hypothetical protein